MGWKRMTDVPHKSGRYIVKHRGQSGGDAYFNAGEISHVPRGWSQLPAFGATHWLNETRMSEIPMSDKAKRFWPTKHKTTKPKTFKSWVRSYFEKDEWVHIRFLKAAYWAGFKAGKFSSKP